jgi:hypothetical protein
VCAESCLQSCLCSPPRVLPFSNNSNRLETPDPKAEHIIPPRRALPIGNATIIRKHARRIEALHNIITIAIIPLLLLPIGAVYPATRNGACLIGPARTIPLAAPDISLATGPNIKAVKHTWAHGCKGTEICPLPNSRERFKMNRDLIAWRRRPSRD